MDTTAALDLMSSADLRSLKTTITSSKTNLNNIKEAKKKSAKSLDIYIDPLIDRYDTIKKSVGDSRQQVRVIPTALIYGSPDLGKVNAALEYSVSAKNQSSIDMLELINNLRVERAILDYDMADIDATLSFLDSIISSIDTVLSTRSD